MASDPTSVVARAISAAGLLLSALPPVATSAADASTPVISGLPWRSGATAGGFPCLAELRSRPLDAINTYVTHASFGEMVRRTGLRGQRRLAAKAPLWVVSLPLLTDDTRGQFAQCAAGAFDDPFRRIGANLQKAGAQGTVVRLGWEANIGSGSHPWGYDSADQVPDYRACFARAAADLKAGGPALLIDWTNAKRGGQVAPVADAYPGDDVVDVVGVHYYDSGPQKITQEVWDRYYDATYRGGPWGLGTWLAFAQAHGKKLGVGEWGVWARGQGAAAADDPVYVENMRRFFGAHAGDVAYETYFNHGSNVSALCSADGTEFPRSAAAYGALWGGGAARG